MKAVGITGGIGVGKSVVAKVFSSLGIAIYDADSRAKQLMNTDEEVKSKVKLLFGEESYQSDRLDRAHVAKIAFHHPARLEQLNGVVHPAVAKDFDRWLARQHGPYVLKEAALLYETGSYKDLDDIVVVDAPVKIRVARVLERDPHRDVDQVQAIMDKQMDNQDKVDKADFVIVNDGRTPVLPQVLRVHSQLEAW